MSIRKLLAFCGVLLALAGPACDKLRKLPLRRNVTPAPAGQTAAAPAPPRPPVANSAEAQAILEEMAEVYAGCRFYADEGRTQSFTKVDDRSREDVGDHRFHTNFVRPAALRLEQDTWLAFGGLKSKELLWAHGDRARIIGRFSGSGVFAFDESTDEASPSWEQIMTGALDVSEIPGLLLPEKMPPKDEMPLAGLRGIEALMVVGDEAVDNSPCIKLAGRLNDEAIRSHPEVPDFMTEDVKIDSTVHLWIEKERKLLRHISRTIVIEEFSREIIDGVVVVDVSRLQLDVERRFTPRINQKAAWHELEFADPAARGDLAGPISSWIGANFQPDGQSDARRADKAREIVAQVLEKHAKCRTYADTGTVELVPISRADRAVRRYRYRTAYQRPDRLRIDVRMAQDGPDKHEYVIWRSKEAIRTTGGVPLASDQWESVAAPIIAIEHDADMPLSPALRLLSAAELEGSIFDHARDLSLLGEQEIDGRRCDVIRGLDQFEYVFTVWVDAKQKCIRRVQAAGAGHGVPRWVTITCKPVINKKLAKSRLQPPRKNAAAETSTH